MWAGDVVPLRALGPRRPPPTSVLNSRMVLKLRTSAGTPRAAIVAITSSASASRPAAAYAATPAVYRPGSPRGGGAAEEEEHGRSPAIAATPPRSKGETIARVSKDEGATQQTRDTTWPLRPQPPIRKRRPT